MHRREFLKSILAGAGVAWVSGFAAAAETQPPRPNILLIMADDHASHAMSCYGSRINKTPNLDRLAREGMRFENCFCTNSICAPSRAVILTGKYSHLNGIINNSTRFDGAQETFPKALRRQGYETALVGKWHLQSEPTGFDFWNILPGQGEYQDPEMIRMGQQEKRAGYATDIITDEALAWLRGRKSDKPFLLMCHHKAPHMPWLPDEKHRRLYDKQTIPEPETLFDDYATRSDAARNEEMTLEHGFLRWMKGWQAPADLEGRERTRWIYQEYIKAYLRTIASVDDNVGRMLDYLDASALAQNTIVIYTSDQGFYLGDHGWFDKRFMYEESLRMPLLIRYPREVAAGSTTGEMVLNLDFAPTLLDFAGLEKPIDMQGRSFRPILQGHAPGDWRASMYYHFYEFPGTLSVARHYGVRTDRYKLIRYYQGAQGWELYDLENDPHEMRNIYSDPAAAPIVERLKAELKRLRDEMQDTTGPDVYAEAERSEG